MPSENQLEKFKKQLLVTEGELQKEIAFLEKNLDFGSDTDHLEEEADETEEIDNSLGAKLVLEKRLIKVKEALQKIAVGGYGLCEKCGEPIETELLEIDPESEWCKKCKHHK